jgi:hypothetical protein
MPATLAPTVRTTYNPQQIVRGLIEAWTQAFGTTPKKESIGLLFAHNSHETGLTVSMWNNNFGNYKYIPSKNPELDNVEYMMLNNVWEKIKGERVVFQPPDPQTWFRSFPTLADGISFYLNSLKNKRFKSAWVFVENGDIAGFSKHLKALNYYTDLESNYTKNMMIYFNSFIKNKYFEKAIDEIKKESEKNEAQKPSSWQRFMGTFSKIFNK